MKRTVTARQFFARIPSVVILGLLALVCLVPIVWLLFAPTKTDAQLAGTDAPLAFGDITRYATAWTNLLSFQDGAVLRWIGNSLWFSAAIVILSTIISIAAGYALATTKIPGRRTILMLTLIAMIVPAASLVLPLFLEMTALKLLNTPLAFILPASFFPFGVYLAFIHFSTSLPKDVLDAARIDGASEPKVLWHISIPLSKSLIGLVAFFAFVTSWTNFFLPFVMLNNDTQYPLALGLQALLASTPAMHPAGGGSFSPIHRPEIALAGLLTVLPIAIAFIASQRYLSRGILAGAVKD
jgi:multiple sugar transport system permease protein